MAVGVGIWVGVGVGPVVAGNVTEGLVEPVTGKDAATRAAALSAPGVDVKVGECATTVGVGGVRSRPQLESVRATAKSIQVSKLGKASRLYSCIGHLERKDYFDEKMIVIDLMQTTLCTCFSILVSSIINQFYGLLYPEFLQLTE